MSNLVSILIPCYNAEKWIANAIESALQQTWEQKEVIVVDDGSSDGSLSIIKNFSGRIRWESTSNRGGNPTRNRLLELARGKWVQYLDADDYLLSKKIESQMNIIGQDTDVDVIIGPATWEYWSPEAVRRELMPISQPPDYWRLLASWELPQTGAPIWRKQAIIDVGGWAVDQPCCQEHELYLRLLIAGKKFKYHDSNGAIYRQWSDTTVCKRNVPEVHRRRLLIAEKLESHLRGMGALTSERVFAINQARFEIARGMWAYDRQGAVLLMQQVEGSNPSFVPRGAAAPRMYRAVFNLLGFAAAERIAETARRLHSGR